MIISKIALAPAYAQRPPIIKEVRTAINAGDLAGANKLLADARQAGGVTPGWLEAQSWIARGHLAAKRYDQAAKSAAETRTLALAMLKQRKLDDEPSLPIALGASIEVEAQVLNAQGRKAEAVAFLQQELKTWQGTSIITRTRKNLHLISLVGRPAPALITREFIGPTAPPAMVGRKVLLFFWAHWCGDCKAQAGVIARLAREHPRLLVVGPTQTYGYAAGGEDAPRPQELRYIDEIRQKYYAAIQGMTVPVSEENFRQWGASTTPTLVVIDSKGVVRLYHPGRLSYEELLPYISDAR